LASTQLVLRSAAEHRAHLAAQAALPRGFRVGVTRFAFTPVEAPKPAKMAMTLIALDRPTPDFAALFTRNAFPGVPVVIGRERLAGPRLGAVLVNAKIANVRTPGGREAALRLCDEAGRLIGLPGAEVLPCSTGVIGWRLPVDEMLGNLPAAVAALSPASALPAAEGIMTTDLYPKVRSAAVGEGRIVGIAKGAGMIEPHLATMLVYLMTDVIVPREALRAILARVAPRTFGSISVDSDTSTSDTVLALSSGLVSGVDLAAFEAALERLCGDLAEDVVRNGEGVRHVLRVRVTGVPDEALGRELGRAVVNSPLVKTAIAGNDPNVGRLLAALGKHVGLHAPGLDVSRLALRMAGVELFSGGEFRLSPEREAALVAHLRQAELYASATADGLWKPTVDYPPHERAVELEVALAAGPASATVLGADLTHEYVTENADYRS
jgi:glutamate N-acetyltransferase/amino-acid N-acetyltransferase